MIIELKNEKGENVALDIIFWKTAIGERRKINGKELIDTYCQVSRIIQINPMESVLIIKTKALQNPLDRYNKIVGKKVALAKAIAGIAFLESLVSQYDRDIAIHLRRRSMRQHIWNVFHQTFKRWN